MNDKCEATVVGGGGGCVSRRYWTSNSLRVMRSLRPQEIMSGMSVTGYGL